MRLPRAGGVSPLLHSVDQDDLVVFEDLVDDPVVAATRRMEAFQDESEEKRMANVPVNIVYPIQGATYPASDPAAGSLSSLYVTASFSVTCSGGPHELEWGFDGSPTGRAQFYDMFSTEQVWKVAGGKHTFWVRADCGIDEVAFAVGT